MDELHVNLPPSPDISNVLPDVVNSQQITAAESDQKQPDLDTGQSGPVLNENIPNVDSTSDHESITEEIPSKIEYSLSDIDVDQSKSQELSKVDNEGTKASKSGSSNRPTCSVSISPSGPKERQSTSWNYDVDSSVHISNESPVNFSMSSDTSKEPQKDRSDSSSEHEESQLSYTDSLNEATSQQSESKSKKLVSQEHIHQDRSDEKDSSGSEDIIKLDIRGKGAPKLPFETEKIIFGPPPEGAVLEPDIVHVPIFPMVTPLLSAEALNMQELHTEQIKISDPVVIEEVFDQQKEESPEKSLTDSEKEQDVLVEEVTIDYSKEKKDDDAKSFLPEETVSFSTMTDYKTICEEYHVKLVHFEEAIKHREQLIEELTISLQKSKHECQQLQLENDHLCSEVQQLQHTIAENSDHDTVKGQLSDFIKYQHLLKDDSTKFYSAVMSGTNSLQSSNGEKDMDREEITINHSKSDLRSGSGSEEFQTGFETKLSILLDKFGSYIEDNLRNKLRESLIQVLCDEIGKMRLDFETEIRDLESQMCRQKQEFAAETRRLRELLSSVKAGNADIEELRKEYEKEMQDLRTFFEEKCSDIKRSYSEDVWRERGYVSGSSDEEQGAGDARRTRSAELPSRIEASTPIDFTHRQTNKKLEQQLEELKTEHLKYINELQARHKEEIASLEEQIADLKAHIQTAENTEGNFSFQQDIDSELEKRVRDDLVHQLQEQIQVLLSDPDAELSSWPLELVALRDKIHGDRTQDKELSSLRDESSVGEADKWRQKRNNSFDQNRQLEEVTKERDGLKRVAGVLQRAVSQLVSYCASAEDELNRTVLAHLLPKLLPNDSTLDLDSRPASPDLSVSLVSREKRVHFAPDLDAILGSLDEEGVLGFLQQQRDLSAELKKELEHSLRRLRHEAHELLELSNKLALNKQKHDTKMLESNSVEITELVGEMEMKHRRCDNCELYRKTMEEAMSECVHREGLLRSDLDAAMMKIAHLMTLNDKAHSDVIAEGYGTGGVRASSRGTGWCSLEYAMSPRHSQQEVDALMKERDDLVQQLEAANRQLKSTRQFVEEQASEREAERDEFARREAELREMNSSLTARLQSNARILSEVEQLENQTREMNQLISELEAKKAATDEELKAHEEKIVLLRDIIANLESQLEQKTAREAEVLEQLEEMKRTIDERDSKMRAVLGELESLRSERADTSEVMCARCAQEEDRYNDFVEKIKEQARALESYLHRHTRRLEATHEVCSAPTSEPSEDVSIRDQKVRSPEESTPRMEFVPALSCVWEGAQRLSRAEEALLKRLADLEMQRAHLNDVAQEVRAERDVLQARMAEQALQVSSLSARLQQQRNDEHARAAAAAATLSVQLHDAQAEVERLKEDLESKDKQLSRLKQNLEEKEKSSERHAVLYGNSCNPKDKVIILERELSSAQARIAHLEELATQLQEDNEKLQNDIKEYQALLLDKEEQLNQIMALKLDDVQNQKSDIVEGKTSGRTLSDIVSISEYDEQDLQMRRAELKTHNTSFTGAPHETKDKTLNRTLPPDVQRPDVSSLNIENVDNFELYTPRADSLPVNFTFTQHKDNFKRNVNETTIFGTTDKLGDCVKHSTAQKIKDNCSMYPNQEASLSNNISVEPKKINFSLEASDNKTHDEFTSLEELGITFDMKQENFPDILSQLKHEVKKSRKELENCKTELKNAEDQLSEFPALKEEVEELKGLLENTMATMNKDKEFYQSQLENFSSNKKALEQKLSELTEEVNEKSKDLNLLKEDILRRENMILELAKEKRNLTGRITELESRINELQNKNAAVEKYEIENKQLKEKIAELQKLEQLLSEKNQQIDSLNQHLDRLDDLQRCLHDRTEEANNLKQALEEKRNELFQVQESIVALNRDITKVVQENDQLNTENKELKLRLSKIEKEQETASLKLQNSESELERVNSLNSELTSKIEELKLLTDQLKDKNTEIEILNEDINSYHNEIALLKEQLKMVSRSPSPRNKNGEEKRVNDRQANNDRKQLVKIKKQISMLQYELDFNKKELNDKAFELAKAKLDVTELKSQLSEAGKRATELEAAQGLRSSELQQLEQLQEERNQLRQQLEVVTARLREEGNTSELKQKLQDRAERCRELEAELDNMRELVERLRSGGMEVSIERCGARSPTAELERALKQQLHHSRTLDEDIMEQILSASSDDREDIPRLALNSSKSSSVHSSSGERYERLRANNERLQLQVDNLQERLRDKEALIDELQRIRDKLWSECEAARLREEAQHDTSARLQLLLDAQQDTATAVQKQDSSMISMLKRRLESAMKSEMELREREQQLTNRIQHLESRSKDEANDDRLAVEVEQVGRLKGEVRVLKSKLELERGRSSELQNALEQARALAQRDKDASTQRIVELKTELAELRRLKHEAGVELVRAKELLNIQTATIKQLEQKLAATYRNDLEDTRYLMDSPRALASTPARAHALLAKELNADEKEHTIRYLQGKCLRLESWRKALVWQKRYLTRVLAGFQEIERGLMPNEHNASQLRGKRRFRCIVDVVVTVIRMGYLVRRRQHARSVAAACLLRDKLHTPTQHTPHPHTHTPHTYTLTHTPLQRHTPMRPNTLASRLLKHELLDLPQDHGDDYNRRSPFTSSPRDRRFIISSPRSEVTSPYLSKLDVNRCIERTVDKDAP